MTSTMMGIRENQGNKELKVPYSLGEWAIEFLLLQGKLVFQHSENIFKFELTLYNHSIPTKQLDKKHKEQHRILPAQKTTYKSMSAENLK